MKSYNSTNEKNNNGFSAEKFVDDLLKEGSQISCDENITEFNNEELPNFYDRDKFQRAQKFFEDNIFAMFFGKFLGLIVLLASPSVLDILRMTNMSGCIMSSYKRYMATIFHMNIWYRDELSTNSRSTKSIKKVKFMHNAASKRAVNSGMHPITQKDMVLTQFGFMGFAIARSEMIGIHNASREDLECLIHFWRVIGHIMGIQEKFNLCRESLEETKEISEILIERILRPTFQAKDKNFLQMTWYLVNGLWYMNPMLEYRTFLSYLNDVLRPKKNINNNNEKNNIDEPYFKLTTLERWYLKLVHFIIYSLKFKLVRLYLNLQHNFGLWIMSVYPFLAVYRFGYKNAMVHVDPQTHIKAQ